MQRFNRIRHWQRVALCFCAMAVPVLAIAQANSTAPPSAPPHSSTPKKKSASTSSASKAKYPPAAHTTKRAGSNVTAKSSHASSSAQKSKGTRGKKGSKQVAKKRGQQVIDSDRAREIQTALIREHYMEGEPTGVWDSGTQAAMQRYQAAQGWQSKTTPDSRALIKLGLGPSKDHLLNPENAMTTAPGAADPKPSSTQPPDHNNLPQQ